MQEKLLSSTTEDQYKYIYEVKRSTLPDSDIKKLSEFFDLLSEIDNENRIRSGTLQSPDNGKSLDLSIYDNEIT